jgi:hypothetical protein
MRGGNGGHDQASPLPEHTLWPAWASWPMRLATNAVVILGGTFLLNLADGTDDPGEPEKLAYFWVPALIGLAVLLAGVVQQLWARRRG